MMLFLLRFWPVLVPLLIYVIWRMHLRTKAKKAEMDLPAFIGSGWYWAVLASLGVGVACFFFMGVSEGRHQQHYEPATIRDGRIESGKATP